MSRENWYEKIDSRLDEMEKHLTVQDANLREHMRRTDIAEKNLELMRKDFEPVKIHVAVVGALGKLLAIVGTLVAIGVGLKNLLG